MAKDRGVNYCFANIFSISINNINQIALNNFMIKHEGKYKIFY